MNFAETLRAPIEEAMPHRQRLAWSDEDAGAAAIGAQFTCPTAFHGASPISTRWRAGSSASCAIATETTTQRSSETNSR
ncbi:3-hydroxybutyrate dehydrogenase [Fulvimarina pelagi HTCC2506]|uniref:3-hydroxybutyrate dehydrogenase n=1 Tax=Fulvimarina pelagi HTCC2506 TaxID=314231 RepID=Q0G319_9HYPH|nr:3-hydroxybutyrate dehydrogenase [Fulvimarina pelagi HTCC2506]